MDMRVKFEFLTPAVQHAEEADLRTEMLGIACDFQKGFCTGAKQEIVISLAIACIPIRPTAAGQSKPKNVIVVFSGLSSREDEQEILAVIESSVRTHAQNETNYFPIDLDYQRAEDKSYCESLAETLRREYKAIKPNVVIASGAPELQFTTQYRDKIFPGVPIVFSMVTASELESLKMPLGMTGVTLPLGIGGAIDLALHLHPDTNTLAVIQDMAGSTESHWLAVTK